MLNFIRFKSKNAYYATKNHWYVFKSYDTIIALYDCVNNVMFKDSNFYSVTTSRQFNQFCREILGVEPQDKNWIDNCLELVTPEEINNLLRNEIL